VATRTALRSMLAAVADTAASGQIAARKAIELAWLFGADVMLYHACYEPALAGGPFFDSARLAAARRDHLERANDELHEVARTLGEARVRVRVRTEWQRNIPAAIARMATREGVDLVVAEPRYRSGHRRAGLSRIDWEVARLCPVPLLLARSTAPYSKPGILAAVDPGGHGVRVSSLDACIVRLAAELAEATDGSVRLVHCLRQPDVAIPVRLTELRKERARAAALLKRLARGAGLSPRSARIVDGEPVKALLQAVTEQDVDLLVLGTIVRGPIRQLFIGSTTEQLMHVAPCDLLLIKPDSIRLGRRRSRRESTASMTA